jgi:hypothetical protein
MDTITHKIPYFREYLKRKGVEVRDMRRSPKKALCLVLLEQRLSSDLEVRYSVIAWKYFRMTVMFFHIEEIYFKGIKRDQDAYDKQSDELNFIFKDYED